MKEYFFLASLPRSGNTLLGSLVNQNKNVTISANSILIDVLSKLNEIKIFNKYYNNFPDEKSFDNISANIFNNYYQNYKAHKIINRGIWGTPGNLFLLKKIIKKPKFIILYRPVLECLASFIKIEKPLNVEEACNYYMGEKGIIGMSLWSIKNIIKEKEQYIFINYKDLIINPIKTIKTIFNFIEEDFTDIKINDFDQFSVNGIYYDDSVLKSPLHKIRTDKVELNKYKIEDYLTANIINTYSNLDI
tara:strand:+ start:874 stop:1614 length:741 start_codon:yes stop_codon:yes gene_type:complete